MSENTREDVWIGGGAFYEGHDPYAEVITSNLKSPISEWTLNVWPVGRAGPHISLSIGQWRGVAAEAERAIAAASSRAVTA